MDRPYIYGQEENTLDVYVNLNGVPDRIEIYEVYVTVYGKEILEQSIVVNSKSNQICPDDINSVCYVKAGVFSFPSELVPEGSRIQACVREPASELENCALGENTINKAPEIISVGVPYLK
jgi:hypothetical protein